MPGDAHSVRGAKGLGGSLKRSWGTAYPVIGGPACDQHPTIPTAFGLEAAIRRMPASHTLSENDSSVEDLDLGVEREQQVVHEHDIPVEHADAALGGRRADLVGVFCAVDGESDLPLGVSLNTIQCDPP